jgi:hypothetical protein
MPRRGLPVWLARAGVGIIVLGYSEPHLLGGRARPYAYLSVMAVGAMIVIIGIFLSREP